MIARQAFGRSSRLSVLSCPGDVPPLAGRLPSDLLDGVERLRLGVVGVVLQRFPSASDYDLAYAWGEALQVLWLRGEVESVERARLLLVGVAILTMRRIFDGRARGPVSLSSPASSGSGTIADAIEDRGVCPGGSSVERGCWVETCLASLTPLQREAVWCCVCQGLSPVEVAPLLGVDRRVVRDRVRGGVHRLRDLAAAGLLPPRPELGS